MAVRSLNHAVLFVSDVARSVHFYTTVLGFEKLPVDFPGAAFLRGANTDGEEAVAALERDPDGIEFEVTWLVPDDAVPDELVPPVAPTRPLDLDAEIARYGLHTPGGPRTDRNLYTRLAARAASDGAGSAP